ncbi:porin family protein [Flavobacterium sp.]|uniref:porin family protein n=1 Tax=Flavobacterium sp. TaxID=239 RepID=UPI0026354F4A|nr:porin family protein [Flavobacterium sp.]
MKIQVKKAALILTMLTATIGFSQETVSVDTRDSFKFGVKAGVNFANVYDEEGQDFVAEGKTGFAAGGFLSIPFGKVLGFQPEVMYSQKGFKATGNLLGFGYDYNRTSTFLDIPLLLQVKPAPMLTLVAGPQFSYLLETKNEFNNSSSSTQEDAINSQNYKKNIFGFVVGADLNFNKLVLSGRAGWDINQSDSDGNSTDPRYKNQVIQFTLGYTF